MGETGNIEEISCNHPEWKIDEKGQVVCAVCGLPFEKEIVILKWNNN